MILYCKKSWKIPQCAKDGLRGGDGVVGVRETVFAN